MILTRLGVENFCQHKHLDITFPNSGVIIIQGANGSGKSNLIRAIQFALSGTVSNTPTKDLNIGWGATSGSVTLDFVMNGLDGRVMRQLGASKAKLSFGDEVVSSVSSVNRRLEDLLGNLKIFEKFVIVQQGRLTEILDIAPAERMKLLHILFKTDKYERIFNAVNAEYNDYLNIQIPTDKPEQIQSKLTELNLVIAERQSAITIAKLSLGLRFDADAVNTTLANNTAIKNRVSNIPEIRKQFQDANIKLSMELTQQQTLTATRDQYKAALAELEKKCIDAKVGLANIERIRKQEDQRATLQNQLAIAQLALDNLSKCIPPSFNYPPDFEQVNQRTLDQLQSDTRTAYQFISSFEKGACPTCGTTKIHLQDNTTKDIKADLEFHKRNYNRLVSEAKTQADLLTTFRMDKCKYDNEAQQFETASTQCINTLESVQNKLSALPSVEIAPDASRLTAIIEHYEYTKSQLAGLERDVANAVRATDQLTHTITSLEDQLNTLMAEAKSIENYDFDGAITNLKNWNTVQLNVGVWNADIKNATTSIAEWTKKLSEVTNLIDRANRQTLYRDILSKVKNTLHRDNLPTTFAKSYFSVLNTEWNSALAALDVPFGVELDANLDIHILFPENRALISQLSGGQQCCLALGFLLAVKKYFTANTNFMVLDEPTYGLDDEHIGRLIETLQTLNDYASHNNMQIFVVTHDQKIKESFQQTITLG